MYRRKRLRLSTFLNLVLPPTVKLVIHYLCQPMIDLSIIDENWSLFLDRDGVINVRIDGYISNANDFAFTEHAVSSIAAMNAFFSRTFVVTNQQGIAKGLMSEEQLSSVHDHMRESIHAKGGHIDEIYHSPDLAGTGSPNRKPATGMGLQAKADFPDIELNKSVMIGDSPSDMLFARNLGMIAVFVSSSDEYIDADLVVPSLARFWHLLRQAQSI